MEIYFNHNEKKYQSFSRTLQYGYMSNFRNNDKVNEILSTLVTEIKDSGIENIEVFHEKVFSINKYAFEINKELIEAIKEKKCSIILDDFNKNKAYLYQLKPIDVNYNSFIYHTKSAIDSFINFMYDNFRGKNRAQTVANKNSKKNRNIKLTEFYRFEVFCQLSSDPIVKEIEQELLVLKNKLFNVVERGDRNSLRNILTHKGSVLQYMQSSFACFKNDNSNDILLVDADIYGYPLINTVNNITGAITYFIFRSLSLIINSSVKDDFNISDFETFVDCPFVNFRDYIDEDSEEKIQLTIFGNNGFTLNEENINKEELLKNCIDINTLV